MSDPTRIDLSVTGGGVDPATDPMAQRFSGIAIHGNARFDVPFISHVVGNLYEKGLAACGDRHWKALNGRLADEQCRLCNEVVVCAYDLDGSPVCADCWPGERLLAERRAAWSDRFAAPTDTATGADQ